MSTDIQTIFTFDTEYYADSVEWYCDENVFVVGTYQLTERDDNGVQLFETLRKGRIYLFEFEKSSQSVRKLQQIECDAVLDQKWMNETLWAATSVGTVESYKYGNGCLEKMHKISLRESFEECLTLSIDVCKGRHWILASDSNGRLTMIDAASQTIVKQWRGHEFEAWTCSFDYHDENIVYSGGDDSILNMWDLRCDNNDVNKIKSAKRDAGVTSFLSSQKEHMLFVGSYDENLCLYDARNLKCNLDEINLHGGIWRIKKSPMNQNVLLVACMYKNFSVVDCSQKLSLIGEYNEHKSICYGCDWSYQQHDDYQFFATCSFYDHRLSVCSFTCNKL